MEITAGKRLNLAFGITIILLIAEVAGGILSNSLALLSDAGHVFTDSLALVLSIIANVISRRPSDYRATYGYQRVGLLAAVINGVSLLVIALLIFFESYRRFMSPPHINTQLMLIIAIAGLAGNLLMAFVLGKGHEDLNIKSAWLHILGDTLSSVGVIVSGIIIYLFNWAYADPLAGVIIGIVIIYGGVRVVKEAIFIFLEMTPKGFHAEDIAKRICDMPGIMGVHDIHIWSLAHKTIAFTAHIWVHDQKLSEAEAIRKKIEDMLSGMGISHIILQFECAECENGKLYCQI